MPRRTDIESILLIGAGPIVIGQACEFDYSGAQACKALKDENYRVILINSNPATIMTDPAAADATYIEPITPEFIERVIAREKPDALLPTMGGQTALNAARALARSGVLARHGVELIGAQLEAIERAEDRGLFRKIMGEIGLETPRARLVRGPEEAQAALSAIGLPAILRPSFTLGGAGGGIARTRDGFFAQIKAGLSASPVGEVLVEESVLGWKEYEMEVVRDRADNCIIVCSIENVDPMGVHTGDSVTVAPALTLTDKEYQTMRTASLKVLRAIGVETGGSNVQFAVDPATGRLVVIETNPRVSRSSALASKATGFPIAKVAARLAVGYRLDEMVNDITGVIPASFEPSLDYVVVKAPRFTFEKFPSAAPVLTTSMQSVGEAMAIGRNFCEALQKALRSLETGLSGLDELALPGLGEGRDAAVLAEQLSRPTPDRLRVAAQALRAGMTAEQVSQASGIDPWFVREIARLVCAEAELRAHGLPEGAEELRALKGLGFCDARLAALCAMGEEEVRARRHAQNIRPVYKRIDSCAGEFAAPTPYLYGTYEAGAQGGEPECEAGVSARRKAVILGGGPNRIGQGIEFDYCCCHASFALKEAGVESVMINCNPETVSTDYDTSDRLYFEPLTGEDVLEVIAAEARRGELLGVIVQFGGQTPLKLAGALAGASVPILGTPPDAIDRAEDRERFQALIQDLGLKQPPHGTARSSAEAARVAGEIGYPVLLRPSYVLGGRAMEIVHDRAGLEAAMARAGAAGSGPVLIDGFLRDAVEVDVDALSDGRRTRIAGVMEHIEEAGVHSGDSACVLPPHSLAPEMIERIEAQTGALAGALGVRGLINVQYAVKDGELYVLEVNPRASRTVPFVAKARGFPVAAQAARLMLGESLEEMDGPARAGKGRVAVKEAVFPFARFAGADVILGPEMRSTGEVMGFDRRFAPAFAKSQLAAGVRLPGGGIAFISVKESDKARFAPLAGRLAELGFALLATGGTQAHLRAQGIAARRINKVREGGAHIVDAIERGEVALIFNTTEGARAVADSHSLRRAALEGGVAYYTTFAGAAAAVEAIAAARAGVVFEVAPLQGFSF